MFGDLIGILNLVRSGIERHGKTKSKRLHDKAILDILKVYFMFKDLVDEGEALILNAAPDPAAKLNSMDPNDAVATLERWNSILDRQSARLLTLHNAVLGQHHLEVLDPSLKAKIEKIVGSKMDDVQNLAQLGAGLVFRNMLPGFKTKAETPNYVLAMAYSESDVIDLDVLRSDIAQLRQALDKYREVVKGLVPGEALIMLSERARKETLIAS